MTRAETVDDDDMGALFRDYKAMRQQKRADNREKSAQRLRDAGIPFVERNGGAHLIVAGRVDAWPGTGLWRDRETPEHGRGIRSLLEHMEKIK